MVRRVGHLADVEIVAAPGQRIAIDQQLFERVVAGEGVFAGAAGEQRILAAFAEAAIVRPRTIDSGNGAVILLDATAHLLEQLVLQRGGGRFEAGVGVGVLGFQVARMSARRRDVSRMTSRQLSSFSQA